MITDLARRWSRRIVEPIARLLARAGLTPNHVTVLGFLLTAGVAAVIATGRLRLAGVLLIISLGADAFDGAVARLTGATSRFGAFLDSTLDRWAEVVIYLGLTWHYLQAGQDLPVLLAAAAMATSLLVSYTRARAEGVGLPCKEGLFTRLERMIVLIAGLILELTVPALGCIALLAAFTAIQRIFATWRLDRAAQ